MNRGRRTLMVFGAGLILTAVLAFWESDAIEGAVTGVIGVAAIMVASRAALAPTVLPALRGLSLTALAVGAAGGILQGRLAPETLLTMFGWFASGVAGLVVYFREER